MYSNSKVCANIHISFERCVLQVIFAVDFDQFSVLVYADSGVFYFSDVAAEQCAENWCMSGIELVLMQLF